MKAISFVVFVVLQVAMLPLAVLGFVLVGYKQMVVSKRPGVSQTAIEVLDGRWAMHVFGIRDDVATGRLAQTVPNTSAFGLWLVLFPLWVKHRLSGEYFLYPRIPAEGDEALGDLVTSRTLYFDRILERVAPKMEQFVMLGAGYDTRAYGPLAAGGLTVFEVDQPSVQGHKRESLEVAGIDPAHVAFVPVDFSVDELFDELAKAGYDASKKTALLWEGVTLYLPEAAVRKTLGDIRAHAAPGSVLALDLYDTAFVKIGDSAAGKKSLDYTHERFDFGLPLADGSEASLDAFAAEAGLSLGESFVLRGNSPKGAYAVVAEFVA